MCVQLIHYNKSPSLSPAQGDNLCPVSEKENGTLFLSKGSSCLSLLIQSQFSSVLTFSVKFLQWQLLSFSKPLDFLFVCFVCVYLYIPSFISFLPIIFISILWQKSCITFFFSLKGTWHNVGQTMIKWGFKNIVQE